MSHTKCPPAKRAKKDNKDALAILLQDIISEVQQAYEFVALLKQHHNVHELTEPPTSAIGISSLPTNISLFLYTLHDCHLLIIYVFSPVSPFSHSLLVIVDETNEGLAKHASAELKRLNRSLRAIVQYRPAKIQAKLDQNVSNLKSSFSSHASLLRYLSCSLIIVSM